MILIGDPKAGKTFSAQSSLHNLIGHFWDFGGQEIMNATHQMFLTKRSVYLLVLDARKDANVAGQIRKWVQRIQATGGNSSIIVVANQIDVNAGFGFEYEYEYELQQEFPQIMVEAHRMLVEMWRTGCVLKYEGSTALVTAYDNQISILVTGLHRKKQEFDTENDDKFKKIYCWLKLFSHFPQVVGTR